MKFIDLSPAIYEAWHAFSPKNEITAINDISAKVSTNLVFRVVLDNGSSVIAKASYFGDYDYFVQDHTVINTLSNNLLYPFENFIGKSIIKDGKVFIHKTEIMHIPVWVVFYNPIRVDRSFPKILSDNQVEAFGREMARFHKACADVKEQLPAYRKTMRSDILALIQKLNMEHGIERFHLRNHLDVVKDHCYRFLENAEMMNYQTMAKIPVFVDWNIGNFSVTEDNAFFSRWDYDWFRMGPRCLDFYFCSRVVSELGDKTVFSYTTTPLKGRRFIRFLEAYNEVNPLEAKDVLFLKEAYRFFILNYVVHHGRRFFHDFYSSILLKEAFSDYLPHVDNNFHPESLADTLKLS